MAAAAHSSAVKPAGRRPPVNVDPIPEAVFRRELSKYTIVRPRDYVGPENLPQRRARPKLQDVVAPQFDAGYSDAESASEFWSALRAFLLAHYSEADAVALQEKFEKAHFQHLASLNLEDIEEMAVAMDAEAEGAA